MTKTILIGRISAPYGIRGQAVITSFTNPINNICKLPLFISSGLYIKLKLHRVNNKNKLICSINEIVDRNAIEQMVGSDIFC